MTSRRIAKVSQALLETVSSTILFGLKDPRVKNVTVTRAEVAADLKSAKVYVSVMGDAKTQALTMRGLNAARGFLQAKVAERLQTRETPVLRFVNDPSVKLSAATSVLLRQLMPEENASKSELPAEQPDEAESMDQESESSSTEGTP
jgi:ribosome-binding factor A